MKFHPTTPLPVLAALGMLLGAGAATLWAPGCPVREMTGLKCPGCGSGRAMAALLQGDVMAMMYWNALLVTLAMFLMAAGFCQPWRWHGWLALGAVVTLFGMVRNLPFYLLY